MAKGVELTEEEKKLADDFSMFMGRFKGVMSCQRNQIINLTRRISDEKKKNAHLYRDISNLVADNQAHKRKIHQLNQEIARLKEELSRSFT